MTNYEARELQRVLVELAKRKYEALNLYEPLPRQNEFHSGMPTFRLLRGSNRGGKTLPAAVEFARAVTGRDPFRKYPDKDGRAYVVGKDLHHMGAVIYRKLFRAGAFKMIRDLDTCMWRAYRPWTDGDREKEAKPCPPLIPNRYVQNVSWESKGESIPSKVVLKNGWEIDFFSSQGKPPQGMDLDLVWFDEEIEDGEWFPEMAMRLLDRKGRFYWSATPQAGSERLLEFHLQCEKELNRHRQDGTPRDNVEYVILLDDNPHIDAETRRKMTANLSDEDERVRIRGEFAIHAAKVFPEFHKATHVVPYMDIPHEWTRGLVIDPGRQTCAVIFAAVPPPESEWGNRVVLYDELYLHNCDARKFGEAAARKAKGHHFEWFIIDHRGSRVTDMGSGKSVEQQYSDAMAANGLRCEMTESGFTWGSDDVDGGVEAIRRYLQIDHTGRPKLAILADKLPNFEYEIARYRYKRVNKVLTDKPEDRGAVHLMACLRYLCAFNPTYVQPKTARVRCPVYEAFRAKQKQRDKAAGGGSVSLGPPGRA